MKSKLSFSWSDLCKRDVHHDISEVDFLHGSQHLVQEGASGREIRTEEKLPKR